jgi:hypothetical protein
MAASVVPSHFPIASVHSSIIYLTNQNLFCTIPHCIPCFLLVDYVLSQYPVIMSVALGVIGLHLVSHFLHSKATGEIRQCWYEEVAALAVFLLQYI